MKIIFLGTPAFAVPTLQELHKNFEVVAVVTQTEKAKGRGQKIVPSEIEKEANKLNIPVYKFKRISKTGVETLRQIDADVLVTCAYGQILSSEILNLKKYGVINVHASVLPKYRGSSPIQWSIINGEKETGITILKSDVGVDDGKVIKTFSTPILENETSLELFERLSKIAPKIIVQALYEIENGVATYTEQDHSLATVCQKLTKEMSKLDFNQTKEKLVNLINGLNAWPVAKVTYNDQELKLFKARVVSEEEVKKLNLQELNNYQNGQVVLSSSKQGLIIKAQNGFFEILEIQAPNSKKMSAKSYLNGKKIEVGSILVWI